MSRTAERLMIAITSSAATAAFGNLAGFGTGAAKTWDAAATWSSSHSRPFWIAAVTAAALLIAWSLGRWTWSHRRGYIDYELTTPSVTSVLAQVTVVAMFAALGVTLVGHREHMGALPATIAVVLAFRWIADLHRRWTLFFG